MTVAMCLSLIKARMQTFGWGGARFYKDGPKFKVLQIVEKGGRGGNDHKLVLCERKIRKFAIRRIKFSFLHPQMPLKKPPF